MAERGLLYNPFLVSLESAAMVRLPALPVFTLLLTASIAAAQSEPGVGIAVFRGGVKVGALDLPPPPTQPFAYRIPDFDPAMRDTFEFVIGSTNTSAQGGNTNGSTAAFLADDGLLTGEVTLMGKESELDPVHHFVTAVNVLDGSGYLFVEQENMNLLEVADMLTSLYQQMYLVLNPDERFSPTTLRSGALPAPEDYTTTATIDGAWLSIADIQEQVFQQTRCHVELGANVYRPAGCE